MALPSQRLDYRLTVSDVDRGVDVSRSLVVAQHPSETPEHVTLRVLAWCLLYEERLELGPGLCDGDAADLVARDLTGAITTWVECGSADADKVKKVLQHHAKVAVHAVLSERRRIDELIAAVGSWKKRPGGGDLTIWSVDAALVDALAAREARRQTWTVTLVGGQCYLDADGDMFEGAIGCLRPLQT